MKNSDYKMIAKDKERTFNNSKEDEFDLMPRYDSRKSFYGKAKVRNVNGKTILRSYQTDVAEITNGKAFIKGDYSPTTNRHIKEFLLQQGFKAESTKQMMKDYSN